MTRVEKVLLAMLAATLVLLAVVAINLTHWRGKANDNAARADSAVAANDTTRFVQQIEIVRRVYGDSMQAVERRFVQVAPRIDALDRALHRLTAANATLSAEIIALRTTVLGTVSVDSVDVRSASFTVDTTPYHGTATVKLPPTGAGSLDLRLSLDPIPLGARVQCGEPVSGYRPATLLVAAPQWATVRIDSVRSAPGVCNPERPRRWYDGRLSFGPSFNLTLNPRTGTLDYGVGVSGQISALRWP